MSKSTALDDRLELRALYTRLARHWGWPMPRTMKVDEPTMLADLDAALVCLRGLVADQCPT